MVSQTERAMFRPVHRHYIRKGEPKLDRTVKITLRPNSTRGTR
jgi:hypothetical protein